MKHPAIQPTVASNLQGSIVLLETTSPNSSRLKRGWQRTFIQMAREKPKLFLVSDSLPKRGSATEVDADDRRPSVGTVGNRNLYEQLSSIPCIQPCISRKAGQRSDPQIDSALPPLVNVPRERKSACQCAYDSCDCSNPRDSVYVHPITPDYSTAQGFGRTHGPQNPGTTMRILNSHNPPLSRIMEWGED